jgi:hypothetical protein
LTAWDWLAFTVFGLAALAIAAGGFRLSFAAVSEAMKPVFGQLAYLVPLITDSSILVFSGLEVVLTRLNHGHPLLRLIPLAGTVATIWLNIASGSGGAAATVAHVAMPSVWVAFVETARHVVRQRTGMATGTVREGIPAVRWLLDPVGSMALWRRMRLWKIDLYDEALAREIKRLGAYAALRDLYGRRWRSKTSSYTKLCIKLGVLDARSILGEEEANALGLVDLSQLLFASALGAGSSAGTRQRKATQQSSGDLRRSRPIGSHPGVLIPAQQGPVSSDASQHLESDVDSADDIDAADGLGDELDEDLDNDTSNRRRAAATAIYQAYQQGGRLLTPRRLGDLAGYSTKQARRLISSFESAHGGINVTDDTDDSEFARVLTESIEAGSLTVSTGVQLQQAASDLTAPSTAQPSNLRGRFEG